MMGCAIDNRRASSGLVLGTAQLGMTYGINRACDLSLNEKRELICRAVNSDIAWIDTARAYGESEAVLGSSLTEELRGRCRIVTKLSPLSEFAYDAASDDVAAAAQASLQASAHALRIRTLDTVLLHRWEHWYNWQGAVREVLRHELSAGRLHNIGASIQTPDQLAEALAVPEITHIQLPMNIVDNRWDQLIPRIQAERERRRLLVHTRSAFLQGLLLTDDPIKWRRAHVSDPVPTRTYLQRMATHFARPSVSDLCLAFVRGLPWVDGIVVGVDNVDQLLANLESFAAVPLSESAIKEIVDRRPIMSRNSLDPACWRPS
jgi:aryl-alcohol dehydrogenase-like predicted oxidoreductase